MDDVSTERLVKDFRVQLNRFLFKLATNHREDWNLQWVGSVDNKWFLECTLVHKCVHFVLLWSQLVDTLTFWRNLELGCESKQCVVEEESSGCKGP